MPSRTNRIRNRRGEEKYTSEGGNSSTAASTTPSNRSTSKLRILLILLVITTTILFTYHLYRLSSKGKGILSSEVGASVIDSFQTDSNVPGGMIVRPNTESDGDAEVKLEDLDMDTLQAAFDALYGDGGPLAPKRGRGGEDGQYSHVFRSKKGE